MNLLITGANGFLGVNIKDYFDHNYVKSTLDLKNADYNSNLSIQVPIFKNSFDVVLHAAGKAHSVPKTEGDKQAFFDVNLHGTINLCAGLEKSGLPKSFIFVSTVAVYGLEEGENITEELPLLGNTPYALSKIQAEQFLVEWCSEHNVILTILRPSLIAGPNPPGNLGAMIQGIKTGKYLNIGGGKARKSVLMVQDIANLLPLVALKGGVYNICDSNHPSFSELERIICKQLNKPEVFSMPLFLAKVIAKIGDALGSRAPINSDKLLKITKSLTFNNEKAKRELGWQPLDVIDNFKIN